MSNTTVRRPHGHSTAWALQRLVLHRGARVALIMTTLATLTSSGEIQARAQVPRAPALASPQSPRVATEIPEVLVVAPSEGTGQDLERPPLDNTAGRDLISPQQVSEAGAINVQEVLRRSPGVVISEESGSDALPNISLRGVSGNDGVFRSVNIAMLADGIPLAPAPYAQPGSSLFPFTLERLYAVDIQKGGASVRYGPNNVSGVINYLTRPIPLTPMVELQARYDSFHDGSLYFSTGGRYGKLGILAEAVYQDGDTYRDNGEYTTANYALKSSYDFSESSRGLLQVEYYNNDSRLSDGLSLADFQADPYQSTNPFNHYHGDQRRYNYKHEWDVSESVRLDLITYYYEGIRTFYLQSPQGSGYNASFVQGTPRPMEVWAIQPQLAFDTTIGDWDSKLVGGLRYHDENFTRIVEREFPDGTTTEISDDRFDYHASSVFVENAFSQGRWNVRPGVRFEAIEIDAESREGLQVEQDSNEVLPALSASYLASDNWSIYANAQKTYQPPASNIIELSSDPQDIASATAWVYELGSRVETEDGESAADLTFYFIDYENRFEPDPDQFDVFVNTGTSQHKGVELTLEQDLDDDVLHGLSAWSSVAYNASEYTNGEYDGQDVPGTPPWVLSWGLRYEHEESGLYAGIDGFYVDSSFSDRENTVPINATGTRGENPSRTVWNANAGWRHALSENVHLHVQGALRNIFDDEYFDVRTARGLYLGAPFSYGMMVGLRFGL